MSGDLTNEQRFDILRSVGEECIMESDLKNLIEKKPDIRCYDGFEPSGRMHIAQGIFKAVNVNKCTMCGCTFIFWVADWFALMNDKVGGELENIRIVGHYLIEVWKAAGMDMTKVEFLWSSEEITKHAATYWKQVLDIGRRNTVPRIKKCCTIMGKAEGTLTGAQVLYPLMQCSDIFFLKADICQLGLDQRKVNMLAREYCDIIGRKLKPVILSHHMLAGLKQGQAKMSKSDPDSAIFMEDTAEDVARKIAHAYCPRVVQTAEEITDDGAPAGDDDKNPVLDYYQCIILSAPGATTTINGRAFSTYEEIESAFIGEEISETDLKDSLIRELNLLLDPVRNHFASNPEAGALLEQVKQFRTGAANPAPTAQAAPANQSDVPYAVVWMPAVIKMPLDVANGMIRSIKKFLADHPNGKVSVILPEWVAFADFEITGDDKDVSAALQFNLKLLQAYGLPAGDVVSIVSENDLILGNSNDYWVTVINVGRKNSLSHIEELHGELKHAGQVVASMMRVADAVMLGATHVISTQFDGKLASLVQEYTGNCVECIAAPAQSIPALHNPDSPPQLLGADDILYLDDNDMDIRRKIKKAYSAEGEAANPIISLAGDIIIAEGHILVTRGEAHGGDVDYTSVEQVSSDSASKALHPGDLKAAVSLALMEASKLTREALATPDIKKLSTTLRNAEKKLSKKK